MTFIAGRRSSTIDSPRTVIEMQEFDSSSPRGGVSPRTPPHETLQMEVDSDGEGDLESQKLINKGDVDLEAQKHIRDKRNEGSAFGRTFKCIETAAQCPNLTCAGLSAMLAIAGLIVLIAGTVFVQDPNQRFWLTLAGGIGLGYWTLDFAAHMWGTCSIAHYIPQNAFDTNIGRYAQLNVQLGKENEDLKKTLTHYEDISKRQDAFVNTQKQMTANLSQTLNDTTSKLETTKTDLGATTERLEQIEKDIVVKQQEVDELKATIQSFSEVNANLRSLLVDNKIITGDYKSAEVDLHQDIQNMAGEVAEQKEQNMQQQSLLAAAKRELEIAQQLPEEIRRHGEKIREQTDRLDESDDKLLDAAKRLEAVEKEKSKYLEELHSMQSAFVNQSEVVGKVLEALRVLAQKPAYKEILFPIIAILEEPTESGLSESAPDHTEVEGGMLTDSKEE